MQRSAIIDLFAILLHLLGLMNRTSRIPTYIKLSKNAQEKAQLTPYYVALLSADKPHELMITSKQWHIFSAAPHRVMFFGSALQALAVMVWLLTELLTSYGVFWHPIDWAIAPSAAHASLPRLQTRSLSRYMFV